MKKAQATRGIILQKAFELIYAIGYLTTSIDDILATTHVTKGAFYYHFKNKDEMGLAIIDELLKPALTSSFMTPLQEEGDPLDAIYSIMSHLLFKNDILKIEYGCPAANFTHEMAPWNLEFAKALQEIVMQWTNVMAAALERGKRNGFVNRETNTRQVSLFIMSGYWGIRNLGKFDNGRKAYLAYLKELKNYLNSLR